MTSKERILKTLEFDFPDRLPIDMWVLPAARMEYGAELEEISNDNPRDITSLTGPFDHGFTPEYYEKGWFVDPWGSQWENIQPGVIGEVKKPIFDDYKKTEGYHPPINEFLKEWKENLPELREKIRIEREKGQFIIGGWISIFERMQYLRGTEELYCDIALEEDGLEKLIELVMAFQHEYLDQWLKEDIDAVAFGDDWGTQISLLISPEVWRKKFKPLYQQLIDKIKDSGKKVFFHSDGYILEIYPDFIDIGVDAINSQIWCMGLDQVSKYAGKITFWGEISRQDILPYGTPEEVINAANAMKQALYVNGGGLIGQSEINRDIPLENIKAFITAWN